MRRFDHIRDRQTPILAGFLLCQQGSRVTDRAVGAIEPILGAPSETELDVARLYNQITKSGGVLSLCGRKLRHRGPAVTEIATIDR
jgi:hypothetical protein